MIRTAFSLNNGGYWKIKTYNHNSPDMSIFYKIWKRKTPKVRENAPANELRKHLDLVLHRIADRLQEKEQQLSQSERKTVFVAIFLAMSCIPGALLYEGFLSKNTLRSSPVKTNDITHPVDPWLQKSLDHAMQLSRRKAPIIKDTTSSQSK